MSACCNSSIHHLVVCIHCSLAGLKMVTTILLNLYDVVVRLLATKVVLAKGIVDTLSNIIQSPVHTIQEQVYIKSIYANITNLTLNSACPYVTSILGFLAIAIHPMLPGISEVTAQNQLVKLLRSILSEQGILQGCRSVVLLELQAERMLWVLLCQTTVTTMQLKAAIDGKVMILRTSK